MEASPDRAGGVSVFAARAGHNRGLPHPLQSGKQSWMHVHPLRSERQVGRPTGPRDSLEQCSGGEPFRVLFLDLGLV